MRLWGQAAAAEGADSLAWAVIARNKKSVCCDLRTPEGQSLVRSLIESADMVIENFRPGTMESWGLDYATLSKSNPGLIMVRVTGFGQSGPYASRAGYGSIGEAMGGLRYLVGDPSLPPSRFGVSIGDALAGVFSAIGALAALHERKESGVGQVVDTAIYESVLAMTESLVTEYVANGHIRERTGSVLPHVAPSNAYPTREGGMALVAANQDTVFRRLCIAMGAPELADHPFYSSHVARGDHQQELDAIIAAWTVTHTWEELEQVCVDNGVPVGLIYRAPDMLTDPQFIARQALVEVAHPQLASVMMQSVAPKLSRTPGSVRSVGPKLGSDTIEVFCSLGVSGEEIERLRQRGIVR